MNIRCSSENCYLEFISVEKWTEHMKLCHMSNDKFPCCFCYQTFGKLWKVSRHLKSCKPNVLHPPRVHTEETSSTQDLIEESSNYEESVVAETTPRPTEEPLNVDESAVTEVVTNINDSDCRRIPRKITLTNRIKDEIFLFLLKMAGTPSLPKNIGEEIFIGINRAFVEPIFEAFDDKTCDFEEFQLSLRTFITSLNSEYKFKSFLREKDLYSDPICFGISRPHSLVQQSRKSHGFVFPLNKIIANFFEKSPDILTDMIETTFKLRNREYPITNVIQGIVWKQKLRYFVDKTVIPIQVYQDEFEINNALGSKSGVHKISGVYITFPLLGKFLFHSKTHDVWLTLNISTDKSVRSKLKLILPACFTFSKDLKLGLQANFSRLCQELHDMEQHGLELQVNGKIIKVYFVIGFVHGDNLGMNTMLGYVRQFRCDGCCRICIATIRNIESLLEENDDLLRSNPMNSESYAGIVDTCPFEEIPSFYITDNVAVDVFHDWNEGILHKELIFLIRHFIKEGFFDLNTLNSKKNNFMYYTESEKSNLCVNISASNLDSKKLKMNGSQIATFLKYLPCLVGEFVPRKDSHWAFLLVVHKLMDLVHKESFAAQDLTDLKHLIKRHHILYKNLISSTLTYKHHIITHYPKVIKELGPIKFMSTIRMEAFHRVSKHYTNCTASRKNILFSLSDKMLYMQAYAHSIQHQCDFEITLHVKTTYSEQCNSNNVNVNAILQNKKSIFYKKIRMNNIGYTPSNVIIVSDKEDFLFRIKYIVDVNNHIFLIGNRIRIKGIYDHFACEIVDLENNLISISINDVKSLPFSCFELNVDNEYHKKNVLVLVRTHF